MKTAKPPPSDPSSSRRAQPLRQTRNNPPRASLSNSRPLGPRGSIGGVDALPNPEQPIEIFPAITQFADAISALPKELVRHFTLLKEVDAKIFGPEEDLARLIDVALNIPPPSTTLNYPADPRSAPVAPQNNINGTTNGNGAPASPLLDMDPFIPVNPAYAVYHAPNMPRRRHFQACAMTMQNMLVSLDEKNHVISTAGEALNKQLSRLDHIFPHIENEVSEEARYGSLTHWAYPENRAPKTAAGGNSRRDVASVNSLSAAAQQLAEEAAARSDARKQAMLAKKGKTQQHADSDFDDTHDGRKVDSNKKPHGNSKVRKAAAAEPSVGVGLGITNGAGTNVNPPSKRRKVEKAPPVGVPMERALSGVFGSNGTTTKSKAGSPRGTPAPEGPKKRPRAAPNGQARKRNNTVTSTAMSPSLASSPIRSTFPDIIKPPGRGSPAPGIATRPASIRARQNSVQSLADTARRPSSASIKPNGNTPGTPDLAPVAVLTAKSIPEVKATMKESSTNTKGEHMIEDAVPQNPDIMGGIVVGTTKEPLKREETSEPNGDALQAIKTTTITTTKSGRASKPSTPAMPTFIEPVRSRSSRSFADTPSTVKRSHKKGAAKWYCDECKERMKPKRFNNGR
ncbi:hypothetical protein CJF32_00002891 [Rutstroemia sp. NJR-2017a WRK4]|nr:hypothetical protein CJF32_00002891 [Rutstroemia sp. NJR-2017a WRK4]